jgi:hypothetical protein
MNVRLYEVHKTVFISLLFSLSSSERQLGRRTGYLACEYRIAVTIARGTALSHAWNSSWFQAEHTLAAPPFRVDLSLRIKLGAGEVTERKQPACFRPCPGLAAPGTGSARLAELVRGGLVGWQQHDEALLVVA